MGLVYLAMAVGVVLCALGAVIALFSWWVANTWGRLNGSTNANGSIGFGCTLFVVGALLLLAAFYSTPARAAEKRVPLPREIVHGHSWGVIGRFGTYSDAHLARRWAKMCATAARYQAMSEAYELGKDQPCKN
jgi:hypothetical protein